MYSDGVEWTRWIEWAEYFVPFLIELLYYIQ